MSPRKIVRSVIIAFVFFGLIIFYTVKKTKNDSIDDYECEGNGVITKISSAGKGSYELVLKKYGKPNDSVYLLGLGAGEEDILVNDSFSKKKKDVYYYFFRNSSGGYKLSCKKEIRGYTRHQ